LPSVAHVGGRYVGISYLEQSKIPEVVVLKDLRGEGPVIGDPDPDTLGSIDDVEVRDESTVTH
jgi:hypothetical protein